MSIMHLLILLSSFLISASASINQTDFNSVRTGECDDAVKPCEDKPVSQTDSDGIQFCSKSPNVVTCLTTLSKPYYCCLCKHGFCGSRCEQTCDTTTTATTTTTSYMTP